MIPAAFAYQRPTSLEGAISALAAGGPEAKILAGGQSLLPLMKLRLASVGTLIDIGRLGELRGVSETADGSIAIGSLTTYAELLRSPVMSIGAFADAVPTIADLQVRNVGTIGGAIAHADPASDLPAVLLALDATIAARGPSGERTIAATDFFRGPFETALAADEILTEVVVRPPAGGSAYVNQEQRASGYALVGIAAVVGPGGALAGARVGITGAADVAYRATAVEQALAAGSSIAEAAAHATDGVTVASDIHADREYRAAIAAVYVARALEAAIARTG